MAKSQKESKSEVRNKELVERSYTAPLIACSIAAVILGLLLIPGVLSYPNDEVSPISQPPKALIEATQKQNEVIQSRINGLKDALDQGLCVADGEFQLPDEQELTPAMYSALPLPPASEMAPCAGAEEVGTTSVAELVDQATVLVTVIEEKGLNSRVITGIGTGFFVRPGEIITNAHVVNSEEDKSEGVSIFVYNATFGALRAEIVAMGKDTKQGGTDLALLKVSDTTSPTLSFAQTNIEERVRAVGFAGHIVKRDPGFIDWIKEPSGTVPGKKPVRSRGGILMKQDEETDTWLYHDAFIAPGSSGGPLHDTCGRVVGVNTATQWATTEDDVNTGGVSKAIALESVQKFFSDNGLGELPVSTEALPKEYE